MDATRTPALAIAAWLLAPAVLAADPFEGGRMIPEVPAVLSLRARVEPVDRMLRDRLDRLLPRLMREAGIDLWLVIAREYADDPVYRTLVPEPLPGARRTSMLVFHDRGPDRGVERLSVTRYPIADLYVPVWDGGSDDDQWRRLAEIVAEREPRRIGVNTSRDWALGDGLSAGLRARLGQSLGPELEARLVSAETLCLRWLETRTERELQVYPRAVAIARAVIAEAFSGRVVTPGVTTTDDVAWYIRSRFADLDVDPWFHPEVNRQRAGRPGAPDAPFLGEDGPIEPGDVLHTDVGICYLRMCTDTQEMGYVLGMGETAVPEGLRRALAVGNRWQDLLTREFRVGRSGNDVLAATRRAAEAEGIRASIYSHPIGFHGHAAGPTIGMWDNQGPTPARGDFVLHPSTAYAIEGNVRVPVPEWNGQEVQIKLEQSAVL
jgi:Xaa-Pro aminopeptidase